MSSIAPITDSQKETLTNLQVNFDEQSRYAGCSAAAAAFLLIGALIVITCSCLCLMLPNINVINHIILPAIVPSLLAIVASIPFIVLTVKYHKEQQSTRELKIDHIIDCLEKNHIPEMHRRDGAKFFLKNFLGWEADKDKPDQLKKNREWPVDYQASIISEIQERVGKEKKDREGNERKENVTKILTKALKAVRGQDYTYPKKPKEK